MDLDSTFSVNYQHRLRCTQDVFAPANTTLSSLIDAGADKPANVYVFVDQGLAETQPAYVAQITEYCAAHASTMKLVAPPHVLPGGEILKSDRSHLDRILEKISEAHLCRRSYVIAVGGGAVLDTVGLATSLAHRGVRLIRVATTTLSQSDSALGVKNGINAFEQKNYLGVYDVPWAVINDEATLSSLDDRNWASGFSEAVKVALLKDAAYFNDIEAHATAIGNRDESVAIPILRKSAEHHFRHITENGDPFERGEARPLDFGHWAAHKLEQITHYAVLHGEAVSIGLALDVTYARLKGWLSKAEHERILHCLANIGLPLYHAAMEDSQTLLQGLAEFQEHLGGERAIPMIRSAGDAFDAHDIDEALMKDALHWLKNWVTADVESGRG
jgi:3-dehydroquinate synthase